MENITKEALLHLAGTAKKDIEKYPRPIRCYEFARYFAKRAQEELGSSIDSVAVMDGVTQIKTAALNKVYETFSDGALTIPNALEDARPSAHSWCVLNTKNGEIFYLSHYFVINIDESVSMTDLTFCLEKEELSNIRLFKPSISPINLNGREIIFPFSGCPKAPLLLRPFPILINKNFPNLNPSQ